MKNIIMCFTKFFVKNKLCNLKEKNQNFKKLIKNLF